MSKLTAKEIAERQEQFETDYPMLCQEMKLRKNRPGLTEVRPAVPYRIVDKTSDFMTSTAASTFWLVWDEDPSAGAWVTNNAGLYSFTPVGAGPYTLDPMQIDRHLAYTGGAAVQDSIYYKMTMWSYLGLPMMALYSYNIKTWEPTRGSGDNPAEPAIVATEVAQAKDGTTYGQFYTDYNFNSLEYGIVNYATKSRTTIGAATKRMVAMGVTSDGKLYGICKDDGKLYQISTSDGTETAIGVTGVHISTSEGKFYSQTGEIDPKTNTFYWAAVDSAGVSGLYTVNLTTGAATLVGAFSGGNVQLYDMILQGHMAADGAPAAAKDLVANFPDGNTTGTLNFTAPTRDYVDENDLSGNLSYKVTANGTEVASGTCIPGAAVAAGIDGLQEGMVKFVVTLSNDAGVSPSAFLSTFIGFDTPSAPDSINVVWNDDNTSAMINWKPVTKGLHDGYIGPITYSLLRIQGKDTTIVAKSTAETSASDTLLANVSLAVVKYAVCAINGTKASAWKDSEGHTVGSAVMVPYFEDFSAKDVVALFTIIDANNDGVTWKYMANNYKKFYFMQLYHNSQLASDDWLITPPIKLQGGREYYLSFDSHGTAYNNEKIEVKFGPANTIEGMTSEILPVTVMKKDTSITHLAFTPSTDGNYYVGFHGCSDKNKNYTYVTNIDIQASLLPTSPAAPAMNVALDSKSALNAKITITAPTKNIGGEDLTTDHLSKIVLKRGNIVLNTFDDVTPGQVVTFIDEVPSEGSYTWTAIPYDGDELGSKAEVTIYIGPDKPLAPQNVKAVDNGTGVHLSWDPITELGSKGGHIDPAGVKTLLYNIDDYGYAEDVPFDSVQGSTYYDIDLNTNEGDPKLKIWGLSNKNDVGESSIVSAALPVGTPYVLPFIESVPYGNLTNAWWTQYNGGIGSTNYWDYITDDAADNDGGSFVSNITRSGADNTLCSYKINLEGTVHPKLVFSYNVKESKESTNGKLQVEVQTADGVITSVYTSEAFVSDMPWNQHIVDLGRFAGKMIVVKFHVYCTAQPVVVGIDKIRIQDVYDKDLSVELNAPESIVKGQTINAVVKVTNEGLNDENAYTVTFSADDAVIHTREIKDKLGAFCDTTLVLNIPTSSITNKDMTEKALKAQVILSGDLNGSNDLATAKVAMVNSEYPTPRNLTNMTDSTETVTLGWEAPEAVSIPFTEDFESYTPFAIGEDGKLVSDLGGGWTTIDGNPEAKVSSLFNYHQYPGQDKAAGFMIFNADSIFVGAWDANENLHGHNSSYQFAAMPYEENSDGFVDGDNYLVSPTLSGEAQNITFFARNAVSSSTDYPETISVLTSKTTNSKECFTNVALPDTTLTGGQWQEFSVPVPEGTKYFAVHQTSSVAGNGNFLLSLDDFTFNEGYPDPVGYNIYCDGVIVGTVSADGTLSFTETTAGNDHEWSVTAVYPDGQESQPVSIITTDIRQITTDSNTFDVYTIDGIRVRSQVNEVKGLKGGVYIVNGNKVIIK